MSMSELKPCPFCGGEAEMMQWPGRGGMTIVRCPECDNISVVNGRSHMFFAISRSAVTDEQGMPDLDAQRIIAAEAWNTRAERTCENVGYYIDSTRFKCSNCGYNGWTKWAKDGEDRVTNYCPNCGAKVVSE
jgi:uncharacterized Zn finger protein